MERITVWILNNSMMAGILVLAVIVSRVFLGRLRVPAGIRLALWGLVALRLIIPFSVESRYSLMPNMERISDVLIAENDISGVGEGMAGAQFGEGMQQEAQEGQMLESLGSAESNVQSDAGQSQGVQAQENQLDERKLQTAQIQGIEPEGAWLQVVQNPENLDLPDGRNLTLFNRVWVAGMVLMLLYAGISSLVLRSKVAVRVPYAASGAGQGAKRGTKIYLTDGTDTPFILGILRPAIYLPSAGAEGHVPERQECKMMLTEPEYDLILAHEQAHIRNMDHLWKPLGFLLLSVYWFQPLFWVAYILFCRDIEFACDERVIRKLDPCSIKNYMETLLKCSTKGVRLACPLAFGEVGVKDRIKAVWNYKKPAFWIVLLGIIACIAIAVTMLTVRKEDATDVTDAAELLKPWAEAFLDKDTEVLAGHSGETVQRQMQETLPLSFSMLLDERETQSAAGAGASDYVWKPADSYPWPQRSEDYAPYQIEITGENHASIYYYAFDPDTLLMYVWIEKLEYEQKGADFQVMKEQTDFYKQIVDAASAAEEIWFGFENTGLDYRNNGLGEKLLARYRKHDRSFYERLSSPMSALCQFLHLDENSVQIQVTNLGENMICEVTFPGCDASGESVGYAGPVVCMTRYGADSGEAIWIPVNNPYTEDEFKEAALTLGGVENWPMIYSISAELTGDSVADEVSLHYDASNEYYDPSSTAPNPGDYERRVAYLGGVVGAVVKDGDTGEILFRQTYSAAHVGNGVFALVHRNGRDYLLTGQCDAAMGESVTYAAEVFSWMNGEQVTADRYEGGFPIDRQEVYRGILRDGENFRFQNSKEVTDGLKELIIKYEDGSQLLFASDNYLVAWQDINPLVQAVFVEDSGHSMPYTLETYYQSVWDRYRCEYTVRYPAESLYGKNIFSIEEIGNFPNHIISFYETETGEPLAQVWHSGGSKNGPYLMDLDHDGKNELISEVSYADGAGDVVIFCEREGKVQIAYATDLIPEEMIPQMGGIGIVSAEYDPDTKKITTYCWDGDLENNNRIKQEYEAGADILAQLQWNEWILY